MGVPDLVGKLFAALGGTAHEICNSMRDPSFLLRIVVNSDKKTGFCSVLFQELSPPGVAHFAGSIKTKRKKKAEMFEKKQNTYPAHVYPRNDEAGVTLLLFLCSV